jgi:RNA polymerase sigma-70 factor (ECF subfamily)
MGRFTQRGGTGADLRDLADEELMELVCAGDAAAFEVVYERHADVSFSLAYRMCGKRQQAEDVVQDAFLSLWRSGARYDRARGSVRTWVLGVVHNRGIDALRRGSVRERHHTADDGIAERFAAADDTGADVVARDERRAVRAALADLPDEQSRAIELAYFGGFSQSEIAALLGEPIGTIKGRMRLGLAKLRLALVDLQEVTS